MTGALIALGLVLLAPAAASAGWSAGEVVSGIGSGTSQTRIAGGSDGASIVVWKRDVAGFDVIQGTRVKIDGSAGPVFNVSSPAQNATDPVVVADTAGNAVVGWTNTSGANDVIQTATVSTEGTVGTPQSRSASGPAGQDAAALDIAVGGDGSVGLAWRRYNGTRWLVQGMRVAPDGTAGPVLDLSETDSSAGDPSIAATFDASPAYLVGWPQASKNVLSREISADGTTLTDTIKALTEENEEGDPHDVHVGVGNDTSAPGGSRTVAWVRHRKDVTVNGISDEIEGRPADDPADTTSYNWAVEAIHPPATFVETVTPTVAGQTYDVDQFDMNTPHEGQPVMVWRHELGGGQYRVETARLVYGGPSVGFEFRSWMGQSPPSSDIENPVIAASKNLVGIIGWDRPAASNAAWTRFSNNSIDEYTENGYEDVTDPGFVQAESGYALAAYTATAGGVSASRVALFTAPAVRVDPDAQNYGRINIGVAANRSIVIRSTGQTPSEVTGIDLAGDPDFALDGQGPCVGPRAAGATCTFRVRFTPQSAGARSAMVTVHTSVGDFEVQLNGVGGTGTRLSLASTPRKKAVRRGRVVRVNVTAKNHGGVAADNVRICPSLNRRVLRLGKRCVNVGSLAVGGQRRVVFPVRVTWRAKRGRTYPVTFRMRSSNAVERLSVSRVKRKRK